MDTSPYIPVLGPIVAATIAGGVAFVVSVLSKEQKTSEFRQAWIDALRNDLSELVAIALQIGDELEVLRKQGATLERIRTHLEGRANDFLKLEMYSARLQMRLNPDEHAALIDLVRKAGEPPNHDVKAADVIAEGQRVLKKEWRRVKRGERTFLITKWISLALFVAALISIASVLAGKIVVQYVP